MKNENTTIEKKKPELKLVGTDGNAFSILGKARRAWREAGLPIEEWETIKGRRSTLQACL